MASDPISVDLSGIINLPAASEDTDGLVELANVAETQEGLDDTLAVTPAAAAATYVAIDDFTEKGDLLVGAGPGQFCVTHVGEDGKVLTACALAPTGVAWESLPTPPPPAIPLACVTGKGIILTATDVEAPVALPVGSNGQVLIACDASETGLIWATPPVPVAPIPLCCLSAKGTIVTASAPQTALALEVGTDGQVLTACASCPTGLYWGAVQSTGIPNSAITGKGAILTGSAPSIPVALPVGTTGQILRTNLTCATGLEWTNVGKTASAIANSGVVALTMDNLRVCFTATGNRTWAFGLTTGCDNVIVQTTCASGTVVATQRASTRLDSLAFSDLGWNFASPAGCASYLIWLGPSSTPRAVYCFTGSVGLNYNSNFFSLTRLF
jgi:DNA-binding transcriptional regulator YdaS (Cro superfamily)